MGKSVPGSRSYSTTARRRVELQSDSKPTEDMAMNLQATEKMSLNRQPTEFENKGHIYALPTLPMPRNMHLKRRDDPLVEQFTRLIMTSGRLSRAQSV